MYNDNYIDKLASRIGDKCGMLICCLVVLVFVSGCSGLDSVPVEPPPSVAPAHNTAVTNYYYCWGSGSILGQMPHHPYQNQPREHLCTEQDFFDANIDERADWHPDPKAVGGWACTNNYCKK